MDKTVLLPSYLQKLKYIEIYCKCMGNLTKEEKDWLAINLSLMVSNGYWEKNKKNLNIIKNIVEKLW